MDGMQGASSLDLISPMSHSGVSARQQTLSSPFSLCYGTRSCRQQTAIECVLPFAPLPLYPGCDDVPCY